LGTPHAVGISLEAWIWPLTSV